MRNDFVKKSLDSELSCSIYFLLVKTTVPKYKLEQLSFKNQDSLVFKSGCSNLNIFQNFQQVRCTIVLQLYGIEHASHMECLTLGNFSDIQVTEIFDDTK